MFLWYKELQMVTIRLGAFLEQSIPQNYCGSLVAAFDATFHGTYLAGSMAGNMGKKMFGVDKNLTSRYEQISMIRPEQNIG